MIRLLLFMLCASASAQSFTQGALNWPNSGGGTSDPQFLYGTNGCLFDADYCTTFGRKSSSPFSAYKLGYYFSTSMSGEYSEEDGHAYRTMRFSRFGSTNVVVIKDFGYGMVQSSPWRIDDLSTVGTITIDGKPATLTGTNWNWYSAIIPSGTIHVTANMSITADVNYNYRMALHAYYAPSGVHGALTNYFVTEFPAEFEQSIDMETLSPASSGFSFGIELQQNLISASNNVWFSTSSEIDSASISAHLE